MSNVLVLYKFLKTKQMILRYFYRDVSVPVLLQNVPEFLYSDTNVPKYGYASFLLCICHGVIVWQGPMYLALPSV